MSTIKSSAENLTLNADGANNDIKFQSHGSEVASIDQAGLVTASGIATTKLDTTATGITVTGSTILSGGNQMTDGISWYNGTNFLSGIRNKSHSSYNDSGSLEFLTSGTSNAAESVKMILNTQGVLSVPTGIELGSGLDATAANTLDDYEEGTWTPTFAAGGGGSLTTTSNSGYYTKVGNLVTAWFNQLSWSSHNLSGTYLNITGLPFPLTDSRAVSSSGVSSSNSFTSIDRLLVQGDSGASTLWMISIATTNNNYAHMAAASVAATGNWYGMTITYRTA